MDLVQLQGFLGLTPAGSKGIWSSGSCGDDDDPGSSFTPRGPLEADSVGEDAEEAAWARAAAAAAGRAALGRSGFSSLDFSWN